MKSDAAALRVLTVLVGAGCALGLVHILSILALHIPLDPNEGWNAYFAQAAMTTGSPYPTPSSLMIDNYPPLSFYIVGAVSCLTGDAIVAGRAVALASLIAVALGIGAAASRMGCGRWEAAFAALFFPAVVMLTTDYAGMDDPQMLAHAIAIGGLLLVLGEKQTPRAMVGAALLFAISIFVKHNLVALPAAVAIWLALLDRRLAGTFAGSGIVFALIGLGLFKQHFGFSLLQQVASARTYSLANVWSGLAMWFGWSFVPLAGAALLFVVARRDRHAMFCVIYAAVAVAAGAYFLGGAGVDVNALFDADIALALSAGVLMNRQPGQGRGVILALLYVTPFVIGLRGTIGSIPRPRRVRLPRRRSASCALPRGLSSARCCRSATGGASRPRSTSSTWARCSRPARAATEISGAPSRTSATRSSRWRPTSRSRSRLRCKPRWRAAIASCGRTTTSRSMRLAVRLDRAHALELAPADHHAADRRRDRAHNDIVHELAIAEALKRQP